MNDIKNDYIERVIDYSHETTSQYVVLKLNKLNNIYYLNHYMKDSLLFSMQFLNKNRAIDEFCKIVKGIFL